MTEVSSTAQVGVVFGRSRNPGPAMLLGSHSDSQPTGGWLDGHDLQPAASSVILRVSKRAAEAVGESSVLLLAPPLHTY